MIGCSQEQRIIIDLETDLLRTEKGITYHDQKPFSGVAIQFYSSSTDDTAEVRSYRNGKEHGAWKQFYPYHTPKEVRFFENGKKEGVYQTWWENGKLKSEYWFENDEYQGTCRDWNATGRLVRVKNYDRGQEVGMQQMWDDNGNLWANYEVRNGRNYGITGIKGCATLWQGDSVSVH
jgi:antitoxin component YwqK of YwqJK toxin-antitoxin module